MHISKNVKCYYLSTGRCGQKFRRKVISPKSCNIRQNVEFFKNFKFRRHCYENLNCRKYEIVYLQLKLRVT